MENESKSNSLFKKRGFIIAVVVLVAAIIVTGAVTIGKVLKNGGNGASENGATSKHESVETSERDGEYTSEKGSSFTDGNESVKNSEYTDVKWFKFTLLEDGSGYSVAKSDNYNEETYLTKIAIPDKYNNKPVTTIENEAFIDCGRLTKVSIPNSITDIGLKAFLGCDDSLYTKENGIVYVDDWVIGVEDKQITSADIKEGARGIADYSFTLCRGLTTVILPNSVTNIGSWVFHGCQSLTSVTMPDSVTSIRDNTFFGCVKLTNLTIPDTVTSIGKSAFNDCYSMESIVLPSGIKSIGDYAFYNCGSLTSVIIPDSVISIGNQAFMGCNSIDKIEVSPENKVYYSVNDCLMVKSTKKLILGCKNSIIPTNGSVTGIGDYAFACCSGLTSITIPNGVSDIGTWAFAGCRDLTSITIPSSVANIETLVFLECGNLTNVVFDGTKEQWTALYKDGIFAETQVSAVKCSDGEFEI